MVQHAAQTKATAPLSVATDLEERFRRSPYWSLRRLVCVCEQDQVIVRGTLPSFYLKQVADSLAANVVGLGHVLSEIEVASHQSERGREVIGNPDLFSE